MTTLASRHALKQRSSVRESINRRRLKFETVAEKATAASTSSLQAEVFGEAQMPSFFAARPRGVHRADRTAMIAASRSPARTRRRPCCDKTDRACPSPAYQARRQLTTVAVDFAVMHVAARGSRVSSGG